MDNTKIILENVTRRYGTQTVLNKINVSFEAGRIHGLIGRNGSGKTMLLKTICGFVRPTEGAVHVFGKRIGKDVDFPPSTGVVMDCMGFVPFYSGYRNLRTLAKMNCKNASKCAADAMTLMGLDYQNKKRVSKYSLGMYQRLQMAQAIMTKPKLLLLDEPFNGIDNSGVKELHKMLMDMRDKGVTIFLATHHEKDIKGLCDDVYEMDAGKIQPAGG